MMFWPLDGVSQHDMIDIPNHTQNPGSTTPGRSEWMLWQLLCYVAIAIIIGCIENRIEISVATSLVGVGPRTP